MRTTLIALFAFSSIFAETDMAQISESFGHVIGKNLEHIDVKFDIPHLVKGIEDAISGKESPMTEKECLKAIGIEQEKNYKELAKENLKQADLFLANNAKNEGIVSLEEGKVQYCVLLKGNGRAVKHHSTPLIRSTVKKIDGSLISNADQEEQVSLDETIPGLKAGLLGMKEGEKRILYIHPDLAFGQKGCLVLPPNLILSFEIEVLKAD